MMDTGEMQSHFFLCNYIHIYIYIYICIYIYIYSNSQRLISHFLLVYDPGYLEIGHLKPQLHLQVHIPGPSNNTAVWTWLFL